MVPLILPYTPEHLEPVISLLTDAFVPTPLHIAAFGPDSFDAHRLFYRIALQHLYRHAAFVAILDGQVCGYMHIRAWPACAPSPDRVRAGAHNLLAPLGPIVPALVDWFSLWAALDPPTPHLHLGPIGVAPAFQRRGVGTALIQHYLAQLEAQRLPGYLETDTPTNVAFYRKFGFAHPQEHPILGIPTWTMWRPAPSLVQPA